MTAVRLNKDYAVKETNHGLKVFPYIEHDGELHEDPYVVSVMLDEDALKVLWNTWFDGVCPICRLSINTGETICDDCYADARRYRLYYGEDYDTPNAGQCERDSALPVEPKTRGKNKLFKT